MLNIKRIPGIAGKVLVHVGILGLISDNPIILQSHSPNQPQPPRPDLKLNGK